MGGLTNNFLFKDRCALPDQVSFVLTFPWRAFIFAMRNRDCTNQDEISILALSVTTTDFPHDMLLPRLTGQCYLDDVFHHIESASDRWSHLARSMFLRLALDRLRLYFAFMELFHWAGVFS
jgi:hypothetical protein